MSSAASVAAAFGLIVGCSSSGASSPEAPTDAGSASDASRDASAPDAANGGHDAASDGPTTGPARFRFANLSPDTPSGLDYCFRLLSDADFTGPILGGGGLAFGQVGAYVERAPGAAALRVVAGGSKDCSVPLDDDQLDLEPSTTTTVAAMGDLSLEGNDPSLASYTFVDDAVAPSSGIGLRFVHAAPGVADVDFGLGSMSSGNFQPIFATAQFGLASIAALGGPTLDGNRYAPWPALSHQALSAHVDGAASDLVAASDVTTGNATNVTIFLVGGKTNDTTHPAQLLMCDDGAPPAGTLSKCAILSP